MFSPICRQASKVFFLPTYLRRPDYKARILPIKTEHGVVGLYRGGIDLYNGAICCTNVVHGHTYMVVYCVDRLYSDAIELYDGVIPLYSC